MVAKPPTTFHWELCIIGARGLALAVGVLTASILFLYKTVFPQKPGHVFGGLGIDTMFWKNKRPRPLLIILVMQTGNSGKP
eukprot:scaffold185252_cov13-Tisochrysis_lutea.AAC.1